MGKAPTQPRESVVLAIAPDARRAARLLAAFGESLVTLDDEAGLLEASREPGVELVIIPPLGSSGTSLVTTMSAIRASRQRPPTWIYCDRHVESLRALMPLARAGANGVVFVDTDDDVTGLRKLLDRGTVSRAVDAVTQAVAMVTAPRHLPLVLFCLDRVLERTPNDAAAVARKLVVSQRTLSLWAGKLGSRGARPLISKCRVLVAIAFLQDSTRTIEQVALELRFSSSAHLHNTIRRYTGMAPREAASVDLSTWCRLLLQPTGEPRANASHPSRHPHPLPLPETLAPVAEWPAIPNDANLHPRTLTQ